MRYIKLFTALIAGIIFAGCAEPVIFSEVFQQNKEQKIYTAYNLWYTDVLASYSAVEQHPGLKHMDTKLVAPSTGSAY